MAHNLSDREVQLRIAFGSSDPDLTRLPHCMFDNTGDPVRLISGVVKQAVGVWGDRCLVDADGGPYLEPEDSRVLQDFQLWALPQNQEFALQFTGKSPGFTMVIPATVSLESLQKTYDIADSEDQEFYYDKYIANVARLLPEFGWAYIPLRDQDFAVFVASPEHVQYVTELRSRLHAAGVPNIWDVTPKAMGQRWNGPIIWDPQAYFGPGST